ncbi:hypothetical protein F5876DRAFT_66389 [Lentinula aff. lateritia]|uniref:Uncharacterized protein n=1 Tax=Lentinula aff. lateritia TaxID=2804960 RepID=A0ACC1TXL6_9AGAR|nr:hypothetical protein F5876DRAFT_66389 [Lentinula aff. lateritia]
MRRSSEELQQRYSMREIRAISNADGPGYLYAYVDGSIWKVGMSNDFVCRQKEWDKDCPCPWRIWFPPIRVANRRRAESLVHLLLEMQCLDRPRIYCPSCQRAHFEKFLFSEPWHVVWSTIGCYVVKLSRQEPAEQVLNVTNTQMHKDTQALPQALQGPQNISRSSINIPVYFH